MDYEKRGYLTANFRLFHISDVSDKEFDYHYHEFDKIVIMKSGDVKYIVEGAAYQLKPWDAVLVRHNEIHRPVISPSVRYDRYVVYITPSYISRQGDDAQQLSACFEQASAKGEPVVNLADRKIKAVLENLEEAVKSEEYAARLYSSALFVELMVLVNRCVLSEKTHTANGGDRIAKIVRFINDHLTEEMTIERISKQFFISRYHLMRLFREGTGETIHSYVRKKRLLRAAELLRQGVPVLKASEDCGFSEYSTFSRAFKTLYGCSPTELAENDDYAVNDVFDY